MSLINNQLDSLHNGVNQQAAEHRLQTQVEEMINAVPSLDRGLLKRNPTERLRTFLLEANGTETDIELDLSQNVWSYEYDVGLSSLNKERFALLVTSTNIQLVDLESGRVYQKNHGLHFDTPESENYVMSGSDSQNSLAAITIKNSTFIANKNVLPRLKGQVDEDAPPVIKNYAYATLNIKLAPSHDWIQDQNSGGFNTGFFNAVRKGTSTQTHAPYSGKCRYWDEGDHDYRYDDHAGANLQLYPVTSTLKVNGATVKFSTKSPGAAYSCRDSNTKTNSNNHAGGCDHGTYSVSDQQSLGSYYDQMEKTMQESLDSKYGQNTYLVERKWGYNQPATGAAPIRITALQAVEDGGPASVNIGTMKFSYDTSAYGHLSDETRRRGRLRPQPSNYFSAGASETYATTEVLFDPSARTNIIYWWGKSADSQYGYDYGIRFKVDGYGEYVDKVKDVKTTVAAASQLAKNLEAVGATFGVSVDYEEDVAAGGSSIFAVIPIDKNAKVLHLEGFDSYGNQASFAWSGEVQSISDLPLSMPWTGPYVKVTGKASDSADGFWVEYNGKLWKETVSPEVLTEFLPGTMPHILQRGDVDAGIEPDEFIIKPFDGWDARRAGDNKSNAIPSFAVEGETIKDMFFFRDRLGFITSTSVILSEVGEYGNFWRTSVAAVLDSDPIDAVVDSTSVVSMHYAVALDNTVMLFAENQQFKMSGGDYLSPKSLQVSQVTAYEINTLVRPIFMDSSVFMVSKRGVYSAVLEYKTIGVSKDALADDITAHVQTYIKGNVHKLSGSPTQSMLFLAANDAGETLYTYKYQNQGRDRVQSAWSKWTFNGSIYSAFVIGQQLYLLINRNDRKLDIGWILEDSTWNQQKVWQQSATWKMSKYSGNNLVQIEKMDILPVGYASEHIDAPTQPGGGHLYTADILIGEWVPSMGDKKKVNGTTEFKSVEISAEEGSEFDVYIQDIERQTERTVNSRYTVNRKPYVMGNTKKIRIGIRSSSDTGFRINTVSFEGNINRQSRSI